MDAEVCPSLQTAARNYFLMLEVRYSVGQTNLGLDFAGKAVATQHSVCVVSCNASQIVCGQPVETLYDSVGP